jgi:hypothetical protein
MNLKLNSLSSISQPVAGGLVAFLLLLLVDAISTHYGLKGWQRAGDNFLGGIVVGVLLFIDQRRRHRHLVERLETIGLMNHYVRNALQSIQYARYATDEVQIIEDSVARIEWALREILPGVQYPSSSAWVRVEIERNLQPTKKPTTGRK